MNRQAKNENLEDILSRFCKRLVACDMDIFGLRKQAQDEAKWITVHPGGKGPKADGSGEKGGTPVLIDDETGRIMGGMGGKFTGQKINEVKKDFVGPKSPTEEQKNSANSTEKAGSSLSDHIKKIYELGTQRNTETTYKLMDEGKWKGPNDILMDDTIPQEIKDELLNLYKKTNTLKADKDVLEFTYGVNMLMQDKNVLDAWGQSINQARRDKQQKIKKLKEDNEKLQNENGIIKEMERAAAYNLGKTLENTTHEMSKEDLEKYRKQAKMLYQYEDMPQSLKNRIQISFLSQTDLLAAYHYLKDKDKGFSDAEKSLQALGLKREEYADKIYANTNEYKKEQEALTRMPFVVSPDATVVDTAKNMDRTKKLFTNVKLKAAQDELQQAFKHSENRLMNALELHCGDMKVKRIKEGGKCYDDHITIPSNVENHNKWRYADKCELNSNIGTVRHEAIHYLDRKNGWISTTDPDFTQAVHDLQKVDVLKKYLPFVGYEEVNGKFVQSNDETKGKYRYNSAASDIIDALTVGNFKGKFGHGANYWHKDKRCKYMEIFADLGNAYAAPDKSYYKELKQDFPALTKAFENIINKIS